MLLLLLSLGSVALARAATVDDIYVHSTTAGTGSAIVFVHGWTCDQSVWAEQIAAFSTSHKVIALDLPGHGMSGAPADQKYTYELYASAIEAVRVEAQAEQILLVGHSMGVSVIRQYAIRYPQHVAGLVGVDGAFRLPPNEQAESASPRSFSEISREASIRSMFVEATPEALQQDILAMMLSTPDALATAVAEPMRDPAAQSSVVLDTPVLLVFAGNRPATDTDWIRQFVPNAEFHTVAGTGHFLMMEQPAEFERLLSGFLRKIGY
ncbi:MAG: alpha/beta hydrolase [Gammaproteobacteria bacterium]|nr:alpha/beta hydrolase [Gammaproteobacteria bacterium]